LLRIESAGLFSPRGDLSGQSRVVSAIEQCAARQRHLLAQRPPRVAELPDHGIPRTSLEIFFGVIECCTHLTMVSLPRKFHRRRPTCAR
jgi:hypothetical protein